MEFSYLRSDRKKLAYANALAMKMLYRRSQSFFAEIRISTTPKHNVRFFSGQMTGKVGLAAAT